MVLRRARPADREDRIAAGEDPEFLSGLAGDPRTAKAHLSASAADRWYRRACDGLHWVVEWRGSCVGTAGFSHLDQHHRQATYAIAIFTAGARGRGVGTAATRLVLRYAFETMGLHRVDLRVLETNLRGIRCYERCGFVHEGSEVETALVDGRWVSDIRMRLLEDEYRAFAAGPGGS